MLDVLLVLVFVAVVAVAAEFVRARCRRQVLASIVADRRAAAEARERAAR